MLCGSVIGSIDGKGKDKARDDETKTAAAQCLMSLLRGSFIGDDEQALQPLPNSATRLAEFQAHAQTTKFIPILGETLSSLLITAQSQHIQLQRTSLQVLHILIVFYTPSGLLPSVLPGTISSLCRVILGKSSHKQWANGAITALALTVTQDVILGSIGDKVCIQDGAVRGPQSIEDLAELLAEPNTLPKSSQTQPFMTPRTPVWLRGTSSQLHIALNTLTSLVSHPSPSALVALSRFSSAILSATLLTLPQSQPLLLSFLLSLSNSTFPTVSLDARTRLLELLSPTSQAGPALLYQLIQNTKDNLAALPRILPLQADEKVVHIAGLIEAVCKLAAGQTKTDVATHALSSISSSIGRLLGPAGGIEKWGWSLLSVLQFESPPITISTTYAAQLMLESGSEDTHMPFPEISFKHVAAPNAREALVRMFRSLGSAAEESCLFSVEWFVNVGITGRSSRSVTALWCACRLLEGIGKVNLDTGEYEDPVKAKRSRRLEKLARGTARAVAELWDQHDEAEHVDLPPHGKSEEDDNESLVQHVKGLVRLPDTLDITSRSQPANPPSDTPQTTMLRALSLQLLSITAGILQTRFTPLLLHILYPVLHSLVSPQAYLSSSALAALDFISTSTSHASIANMLFSNFDYALDAVSRRLTRRWLDVDATKVLAMLVRLIGSDVVHKAGDVVEECFDRLDDFHGYEIVVEGLLEVLGEVMSVVMIDEELMHGDRVNLDTKPIPNPTTHQAGAESEDISTSQPQASEENDAIQEAEQNSEETILKPAQKLAKQIVSRSLYFLSHESPVIRARILMLLSSSAPVLPESALLPSIHHAWPFILNRLADPEPFVAGAAASLITSLTNHFGEFMFRRIWDDVWPRFRTMLGRLDAADATNALARRGHGAVGTESAYTHSHRLYRSLLQTMTAVSKNVQIQDSSMWQVILAFRRFLHSEAHEELQGNARDLYVAIGANNRDAVWLALEATSGHIRSSVSFLQEPKWDIESNLAMIYSTMDAS